MKRKLILEVDQLLKEAKKFAKSESSYSNAALYGVTDGKAVGTYLEHKFQLYLNENYDYTANGYKLPFFQ